MSDELELIRRQRDRAQASSDHFYDLWQSHKQEYASLLDRFFAAVYHLNELIDVYENPDEEAGLDRRAYLAREWLEDHSLRRKR